MRDEFDEVETIDRNPKSWVAWKREAERLQGIIDGMALAAMDSEPVAHVDPHCVHNIIWTDYGVALENIGVGAPLFAAPQPATVMPDGYVLVPKEPTEDMRDVYYESSVAPISRLSICGYQAMLAAAPHDTPAINSVQSVVTVPGKWIPVSDRLPSNEPGSYEYLVYETLNNRVQHDYWNSEGEHSNLESFWNHYGNYVTHWQPLPEPPQEGNP